MNSLRHRLTLLLLASLVTLLIGGAAVLYPVVRRLLITEFDYALLAKAQALTSLPERERRGVNLQFTEMALPEFQPGPGAEYFQVWLKDGSTLARSPSLAEANLPLASGAQAKTSFQNVTLPDGRPGRAVTLGLLADEDGAAAAPAFYLTFARDRVHLDQALLGLFAGLAAGGAVGAGLMGWLVQRTVRSGLQPVNELAAQVTDVGVASLDTRFSLAELPLELKPIAAQLNGLLDRLRAAFEREKRFSANAAHELATPISELRALAEISLRLPRDRDIHLAEEALEIAKQMQRIVDTLLALARQEGSLSQLTRQPVNLTDLIREISSPLVPRMTGKQVRWTLTAPAGAVVRSDRTLLHCILSNLVENAVEYTPPKGEILCCLEGAGESTAFSIANTNPGLTHADLPRLFEPWWRKDAARSGTTHTGLGLALVKTCTERLGLSIQADLPGEDTVRFQLSFKPAPSHTKSRASP